MIFGIYTTTILGVLILGVIMDVMIDLSKDEHPAAVINRVLVAVLLAIPVAIYVKSYMV